MDRYGRGIWAGTLRHHDGRFYLYFGTPDEGFFMTSAAKAEGLWDPLTCLLTESGWDDCSVIWDEDGDAWFVGTCFRKGYKTYLFRMASDGRSIHRSTARLVNEGYGREANKLIYHDGYYYLIFSEPDADATGTGAGGHATGTGAEPDADAMSTGAGFDADATGTGVYEAGLIIWREVSFRFQYRCPSAGVPELCGLGGRIWMILGRQ